MDRKFGLSGLKLVRKDYFYLLFDDMIILLFISGNYIFIIYKVGTRVVPSYDLYWLFCKQTAARLGS